MYVDIFRYAALSKEDDHRSRAFGRGLSPHRGQGRTPSGFQKGRLSGHGSQELERERALASARWVSSAANILLTTVQCTNLRLNHLGGIGSSSIIN